MIIDINLFWIIVAIVIIILAFLLHNLGGTKLFIDKDKHIANKFFDKFPLVSQDFFNKSTKEQNIENNQEIHEINKKIEQLTSSLHAQNANINNLVRIIDGLNKKHG